jgi:hypothetical protein
MDFSGLVIPIGIAVYGVLAYQHRDRLHKETMACINKGEKPLEKTPEQQIWRLATTAGMGVLLLVVAVRILYVGIRLAKTYDVLFFLAMLFAILGVLLGLIFLRDLKLYRNQPKSIRRETI